MTKFYFEQQGNIIAVKLSSDVSVNAWEGAVVLPDRLATGRIITAGSVSEIWQTPPRRESDRIVFIGGKPNGFAGDGLLFKFIAEPGRYNLQFLSQTTAYLNDGRGTRAETTLATLAVEPAAGEELVFDTIQPQPFRPTILRDEQFFDGRPAAVFSAEDFESGISHYEIREYTTAGISGWHRAISPYLIQPDVRKLEIKAVDNFGNERIESLPVSGIRPEFVIVFAVIVIVIAVMVMYNIRRWRKH